MKGLLTAALPLLVAASLAVSATAQEADQDITPPRSDTAAETPAAGPAEPSADAPVEPAADVAAPDRASGDQCEALVEKYDEAAERAQELIGRVRGRLEACQQDLEQFKAADREPDPSPPAPPPDEPVLGGQKEPQGPPSDPTGPTPPDPDVIASLEELLMELGVSRSAVEELAGEGVSSLLERLRTRIDDLGEARDAAEQAQERAENDAAEWREKAEKAEAALEELRQDASERSLAALDRVVEDYRCSALTVEREESEVRIAALVASEAEDDDMRRELSARLPGLSLRFDLDALGIAGCFTALDGDWVLVQEEERTSRPTVRFGELVTQATDLLPASRGECHDAARVWFGRDAAIAPEASDDGTFRLWSRKGDDPTICQSDEPESEGSWTMPGSSSAKGRSAYLIIKRR